LEWKFLFLHQGVSGGAILQGGLPASVAVSKGGVDLQRWGRIAKVGAKRKERGGVKTQRHEDI